MLPATLMSGKGDEPDERDSSPPLTNDARQQLTRAVSVGCDLATAARIAGCPLSMVQAALDDDAVLHEEIQTAQAKFEFRHLMYLEQAASDVKNWRVSTWLLERRFPARYERRRPRSIRPSQVTPLLCSLAEALSEAVVDSDERAALLDHLDRAARELGATFLRDLDDAT